VEQRLCGGTKLQLKGLPGCIWAGEISRARIDFEPRAKVKGSRPQRRDYLSGSAFASLLARPRAICFHFFQPQLRVWEKIRWVVERERKGRIIGRAAKSISDAFLSVRRVSRQLNFHPIFCCHFISAVASQKGNLTLVLISIRSICASAAVTKVERITRVLTRVVKDIRLLQRVSGRKSTKDKRRRFYQITNLLFCAYIILN